LAGSLSEEQLRALARYGAQARLTELRNEMAAIKQEFPAIRGRRGGRPRTQASAAPQPAVTATDAPASGRRGWTAAQRKAAGERMKAYWAKRKAGKKK
jgi:hypothetical protein